MFEPIDENDKQYHQLMTNHHLLTWFGLHCDMIDTACTTFETVDMVAAGLETLDNIEHDTVAGKLAGLLRELPESSRQCVVFEHDDEAGLEGLKEVWSGIQDYASASMSKFMSYSKSLLDFDKWVKSQMSEIIAIVEDKDGNVKDLNKLKLGKRLRNYQYVAGKIEDPVKVLNDLNSYLEHLIKSDGLYKAASEYLDSMMDQLDLIDDEGNVTDKDKFKNVSIKAYGPMSDSVCDYFQAKKKVDDSRFGKKRYAMAGPLLPGGRTMMVPIYREVMTKFEMPRGTLQIMDYSKKDFSGEIEYFDKKKISEVFNALNGLIKTTSKLREVTKRNEKLIDAYDDAVKKIQAKIEETGNSEVTRVVAKQIMKYARSDAFSLTRGLTDIMGITNEVTKLSIYISMESAKAMK